MTEGERLERFGTTTPRATKTIQSARCRRCSWCHRWFHISWIAYHNCPILHRAGLQ